MERTLVILKPGCLQRGLVGEVISRFEKRGLQLVAIKMAQLDEEILKVHYAHLLDKKFLVKPKQKVVRGELIALSGNSGKSTGPHLHYEVIVKGKNENPINYYFMDLDADGYDMMLNMAENHGKIYD